MIQFVDGMSIKNVLQNRLCEHCIVGKQKKGKHRPARKTRANEFLELVHSDLCEMPQKSKGGSRYYVLFIDDHSRKSFIYFLKRKGGHHDQIFRICGLS